MAAKRPASADVSDGKRQATDELRSMAEISNARRERLQMLSLVNDDVLNMVRYFVCPPDSPPDMMCVRAPALWMIGAPFDSILFDDTAIVALAEEWGSRDCGGSAINFALDARKWSTQEKCTRLLTQLLHALGTNDECAPARAALISAWDTVIPRADLALCEDWHSVLCMLVRHASGGNPTAALPWDAYGLPPVCPSEAFEVAYMYSLYGGVERLMDSPINGHPSCRDVTVAFEIHIPNSLMERLIRRCRGTQQGYHELLSLFVREGATVPLGFLIDSHGATMTCDDLLLEFCLDPRWFSAGVAQLAEAIGQLRMISPFAGKCAYQAATQQGEIFRSVSIACRPESLKNADLD